MTTTKRTLAATLNAAESPCVDCGTELPYAPVALAVHDGGRLCEDCDPTDGMFALCEALSDLHFAVASFSTQGEQMAAYMNATQVLDTLRDIWRNALLAGLDDALLGALRDRAGAP